LQVLFCQAIWQAVASDGRWHQDWSGLHAGRSCYKSLITKGVERRPEIHDHPGARRSDDDGAGGDEEVPAQAADGLVDVEGGGA
jgi:hypothetical protein